MEWEYRKDRPGYRLLRQSLNIFMLKNPCVFRIAAAGLKLQRLKTQKSFI